MYNTDNIFNLLNEKTGLCYYDGGQSNIMTLCPFCEKERFFSNRSHGHMSISLSMPVFHCFRCEIKGIVTSLLKEYGVPKDDYPKYISEDSISKDWKQHYIKKVSFSDKNNIEYKIDRIDYSSKKLDYLKKRFGEEFDFSKVDGLIIDVYKFFTDNKIYIAPERYKIFQYLDDSFVGFLSTRGSQIVFRNTDVESTFRYYVWKLDKQIFFKDFYSLDGNDKTSTNIVIAEGIFDIINSRYDENILKLIPNSLIWASTLGNNYNELILSVMDYCKLTSINVILLSDSDLLEDKKFYFIKKLPFVNSLKIYYNRLDKDFGSKNIDVARYNIGKYYAKKSKKT